MEDNKEIILTKDGMQKLTDELDELKTVRRPEVSEKIKIARGFGDLSENAEYDEAKKEQAEVEQRIAQIEDMLKYARVLDDSEIVNDSVGLGSTVKLWDVEFEEEVTYTIVGTTEADPTNGKLSADSPVGKGLLGHKAEETVSIQTPGGTAEYKILEIAK